MKGEISTAPTLPPPGPLMPGAGESGPGVSSQQDEESDSGPSDSSKVISSSPFLRKAGEDVIFGTQVSRKPSMSASAEAPLGWLVQGKSWPSLHRFGVMKEKSVCRAGRLQVGREAGLAAQRRRRHRPVGEPSATTCASQ